MVRGVSEQGYLCSTYQILAKALREAEFRNSCMAPFR